MEILCIIAQDLEIVINNNQYFNIYQKIN